MSQHVLIIGAVALGPKTACRFKRLEPGSTVTMIDQNDCFSYGGCGIPYYVSGDVSEVKELRNTSFHMTRDVEFFRDVKGVDMQPRTRALSIDRENKRVLVQRLDSGEQEYLPYDKLVIATGSSPRKLPLPGADLPGVHMVSDLHDAEDIRAAVTKGEVSKAVIVGAGFIGLEMAEALADMWGVETTVVEITDQILPGLVSPSLAHMAQKHMEENGVEFLLGHTVQEIQGTERVTKVVSSAGELEADLVVMATGVVPGDALARECGLDCHERGGIVVDEEMRTTDPDIYAGGDCVVVKHLVTEQPFFLPLGSMSNRQGRVIGDNLAGRGKTFPGAVGSFVVKLFETSAAGTGLSLAAAKRAGFDAVSVFQIQLDRAHFYPTKELMTLELVVEKGTRRVLGIQGFAGTGDAMVGRINAVAALLPHKPTVDDLSNMELAYSPPFASAMDVLNSLGNVADNVLDGRNVGVMPDEFAECWESDQGECFFLDCREEADAGAYVERLEKWHNIPQGQLAQRLAEVPRDKRIMLICNTGARSYEAQITLMDQGFAEVFNLQGGMAGLKKWGLEL
ncbi:NADPH-dependent 2,4-dienoyl-CoA reductase, sulfur reductase [Paucidesulfovibrio gracilis DSM 16080]|uniref:NADPH-dependent 2,4-dienoyl-CoA reductase, sulfur reductase n=1 Tax=Paucidesulfovibrio gracilis DSM 16080 TaxID=1121449 RepID=A0A1T4X5K4_9BACT|nr:FAD-dependent oxidoreductase [Paucidesulfovibrio gracilis]SKA84345.1 NADPH-dependent 2,4-dienoyl-CoA reductase, sulfur reductase [Paucidesulfovibrio gracilis DSM 16080]